MRNISNTAALIGSWTLVQLCAGCVPPNITNIYYSLPPGAAPQQAPNPASQQVPTPAPQQVPAPNAAQQPFPVLTADLTTQVGAAAPFGIDDAEGFALSKNQQTPRALKAKDTLYTGEFHSYKVKLSQDAYVYVVQFFTDGSYDVLFGSAAPLSATHEVRIPSRDTSVWYELDGVRGQEHLYIIASREALQNTKFAFQNAVFQVTNEQPLLSPKTSQKTTRVSAPKAVQPPSPDPEVKPIGPNKGAQPEPPKVNTKGSRLVSLGVAPQTIANMSVVHLQFVHL